MEPSLIIFILVVLMSGTFLAVALSLYFCACIRTLRRLHQEKIRRREIRLAEAEEPPPYALVVSPCRLNNCSSGSNQEMSNNTPNHFPPSLSFSSVCTHYLSDYEARNCNANPTNLSYIPGSTQVFLNSHHHCCCNSRRPSDYFDTRQDIILSPFTDINCSCACHSTECIANLAFKPEEACRHSVEQPPPTYVEAVEIERRESLCPQRYE